MDTYSKYKKLFMAKVRQTELGILAGLNLLVKKVGVDRVGLYFIDRFMLFSSQSSNKWIPLFIIDSPEQKIFNFEITDGVSKFTILVVSNDSCLTPEVIDFISLKFNSLKLSLIGELPKELVKDYKECLNWQTLDKPLLLLKGIKIKDLPKPGKFKSFSSLTKAEKAAKILSKDTMFIYQQKFNSKK